MNNMILISVIVPVYNSAHLVHLPMNSLLEKQDMQPKEFEVICINDGSTDNSLEVLNLYKKKYKNVSVITQENRGLGGARNTGIKNAQGKYILFVDADDYIGDNVLKSLFNNADSRQLDILEFGGQMVELNPYKIVSSSKLTSESDILTGEEYLAYNLYSNSACNKLYRNDFLKSNNFYFTPKIYVEDIEFNTRVIFSAKRIKAVDTIYAYYVQTPGSITRAVDKSTQIKMVHDILWVLLKVNQLAEDNNESVAYLKLKRKVSSLVITMMLRIFKCDNNGDLFKEITNRLSKNNLYPLRVKADTFEKNMFRLIVNNNLLFRLCSLSLRKRV